MKMYGFEKVYGLIGNKLGHSFSKDYFNDFFSRNNLNYSYQNIEIENIEDIISYIKENKYLKGFNVTIPYKESIIPFLDNIDDIAKEVGAVNTVKIENDGKLTGFNTDVIGFDVLCNYALDNHTYLENKDALIFGSGGASKAVQYTLRKKNIPYKVVTRNCKTSNDIGYSEVNDKGFHPYSLIINATPVGMYPNIEDCLQLPYSTIESHNVFIDLIYNPLETLFLKKAKSFGAATYNGLKMLYGQAEAAWKIWNN